MNSLADLIEGSIQEFESPNVFNPWREGDPMMDIEPSTAAQWRRIRLEQHFDCDPKFVLIGEAPGYQGCHFSGVPFTNEKLIMDGAIPRIRVNLRITRRDPPYSEPSATIVWSTLHRLGIAESTVMWNAFAWHPHKANELLTNRAPSQAELIAGAPVLRAVVDHFRGATIIAVGNTAEWTLNKLGIKIHAKIRHPSMGGATKFRAQMADLFEEKVRAVV